MEPAHPLLERVVGAAARGALIDLLDAVPSPVPTGAAEFGLSVLYAGAGAERTAAFADRHAARHVIPALAHHYETLVLDCPPLLPYPETLSVAGALDGVILVVEAERDKREVVNVATARVQEAGGRVLGVILNKKPLYIPRWLYRRL